MLTENLPVPFDRRVWQEASALERNGYDVVVICPRGPDDDRRRFTVVDNVKIYPFDLRPAQTPLGYLREYGKAAWEIARLGRNAGVFDIVHAANPPDFLLALAWPWRRRGARLIFDQHDLSPELYLSRFARRDPIYRGLLMLERISFLLADVVIATNESYRRVAIERGRKQPEDVFVVRNAPAEGRFRTALIDNTLKRGARYLLAYVGMMGRQDNVDVAIRALAHLRNQRTDWHALFLGAGDALPSLQALSNELRLERCVEFTGLADDELIARVLTSADACLSPELPGPLNDRSTLVKVVEYMTMGRPVVAFDLAETRASAAAAAEYVVGGPSEYAAAISGLLDNPSQRERMGEIGRERALGLLSWRESERQLLAAYARVLKSETA